MLIGEQGIESLKGQLTVSMSKYQTYLKLNYSSLLISSPEELLDCSSSEYVQLYLKRFNEETQTFVENFVFPPIDHLFSKSFHSTKTSKVEGESLTLVNILDVGEKDVVDVEKKRNKVILIEGGPGMGKSTLAIKMCKSWAAGELLQEYDAVIRLPLRDPELQGAQSIKDLLLTEDEVLRDEVYKEMVMEHGSRVCFILEGYDELPRNLRNTPAFSKFIEKLPKCTLVYTSRPEACDVLRRLATHIIRIYGFKEEQIYDYIKNSFQKVKNGKEMATKLISQVKSNSKIMSILYIPINVAIICHLFLISQQQLPNTLTELYTFLCINLILRHIDKQSDGKDAFDYFYSFDALPTGIREQFLNLCLIAYKGMVVDKMIFSSHDIERYHINAREMNGLGLLLIAPSPSGYGRENCYKFLHLTLQEFCAAYHISKSSTQEQLKYFNQHKFQDSFNMIWRFYSGITKLRNNELLNQMLPSKLTLVYSPYRGRRNTELLHRIHEAQNDDLCQHVSSHLDGKVFLSGCELDLIDCTAVGYLFKQCRELKIINCRECNIDDDCFKILVNSLLEHSGIYSTHIQLDINDHNLTKDKSGVLLASLLSKLPIVSLDISDGNVGIVKSLCNSLLHKNILKELHVQSTDLLPEHMHLLSQTLSNNNTLSVLDISGSEGIGPDGCQHLANVRNTSLSELVMGSCNIGASGADHIGKLLIHNTSIRSVELNDNKISDDGVKILVEHLMSKATVKQLDLQNNDITSIGAGYLSKLFTCNPCTLLHILLNKNPLEDKGVELIFQSIAAPMEWVGMSDTKMTLCDLSLCNALHKIKSISFTPPDNCDSISNSLADTTMLEGLWLGKGSDASYNRLITGIRKNHSIKTLYFSDGNLYSKSVKNLAEVIKGSKTITTIGISQVVVSALNDYLLLAKALAENSSVKNMMIITKKKQLKDTQIWEFLETLKLNDFLELLVIDDKNKVKYDDQFNKKVEMLVEKINDERKGRGVTTLLHVNMYVDISNYHFKQVNFYIIHYT